MINDYLRTTEKIIGSKLLNFKPADYIAYVNKLTPVTVSKCAKT